MNSTPPAAKFLIWELQGNSENVAFLPPQVTWAYTPRRQIPMELESQARLANAALLANWDYENHCFGHLWDFGHRDVCKSLECR